jgi:hypothetical protein
VIETIRAPCERALRQTSKRTPEHGPPSPRRGRPPLRQPVPVITAAPLAKGSGRTLGLKASRCQGLFLINPFRVISCAASLQHDPENGFRKRSCSNKDVERDDDSTRSHRALGLAAASCDPRLPSCRAALTLHRSLRSGLLRKTPKYFAFRGCGPDLRNADPPDPLGALPVDRRARGRDSRAVEKRHELPPSHSITSSARARSASGTTRPSALTVLRLNTSSNLLGCSTGKSCGLVPCKILCT